MNRIDALMAGAPVVVIMSNKVNKVLHISRLRFESK